MSSLKGVYEPVQAIVVNKNVEQDQYYLESFKIDKDGSFKNGKPLTEETLAAIFQHISVSVTDRLQFKGRIPDNILLVRNNPGDVFIAWISKPQRIKMFFTDHVGLKDGCFNIPSLLWVVHNKSLHIYALKTNTINAKTKLYQIPFPNVSGGNVCWGSGKWPSNVEYYEDYIEGVMSGFWSSKFSHKMNKEMLSIWKPIRNRNKPFPKDKLKVSSRTNQVLKQLGYERKKALRT